MRDFHEVQKFKQWWLWILIVGVALVPFIGLYKQVIIGEEFGNSPMSNLGLAIFAIAMLLLVLFFRMLTLKTDINKYEINFSFYPFVKKKVKWEDVINAKMINYGFVGYGIRLANKRVIYNTGGRFGLLVELKNGKSFVLGTQKEKELEDFLQKRQADQKLNA